MYREWRVTSKSLKYSNIHSFKSTLLDRNSLLNSAILVANCRVGSWSLTLYLHLINHTLQSHWSTWRVFQNRRRYSGSSRATTTVWWVAKRETSEITVSFSNIVIILQFTILPVVNQILILLLPWSTFRSSRVISFDTLVSFVCIALRIR